MSDKEYQRYTVTALDEFDRLYHHSYVFGFYEDLDIPGIASQLMQRLIFPILKKMGEDASAVWTCTPERWISHIDGSWDYEMGVR